MWSMKKLCKHSTNAVHVDCNALTLFSISIIEGQHGPVSPKLSWSLQWRHNDHDGVSNHQPHGCLLNHLFRRRSKQTSKLRVTGLCAGNSPGTGEFPTQMTSNAENVSIWWRHHEAFHCYPVRTSSACLVRVQISLTCRVRTRPQWFFLSGSPCTNVG